MKITTKLASNSPTGLFLFVAQINALLSAVLSYKFTNIKKRRMEDNGLCWFIESGHITVLCFSSRKQSFKDFQRSLFVSLNGGHYAQNFASPLPSLALYFYSLAPRLLFDCFRQLNLRRKSSCFAV